MFSEIVSILKENNDFAIVSHTSPDGDSMGSMLGLYNLLKENGKNSDVFIDGELPRRYSFLPGFNQIKQIHESNSKYNILIVLDCGDIERLGNCKELINKAGVIINIDHHISNGRFGDINYVDIKASSTGEILYELTKTNNINISKESAECLYTAILTDTGGFKYSNTTPKTFSICGELIEKSINFPEITNKIYDTKTIPQVKLLSMVTSTLEMHLDKRAALLYLTKDMIMDSGAREEDASEFVNIARDIEDVEVGILLKQINEGEFRASLRSKNWADVRAVAEIFGGGGHIRAAGCTIKGSLDEVKKKLINEISKVMDVFK